MSAEEDLLCQYDEIKLVLADEPQEEVDLHRLKSVCPKNPGHKEFIPADDFDLHHLPETFRDEEFVDTIKTFAKLTTRIKVMTVSDDRPDDDSLKILKKDQGDNYIGHVGTCFIVRTHEFHKRGCKSCTGIICEHLTRCPCQSCQFSSVPEMEWGVIRLITAKHVVYDSSEAYGANIWLFYNSEKSRREVKTLTGYEVIDSFGGKDDSCTLSAITHDADLLHQLEEMTIAAKTKFDYTFKRFKKMKDDNCVIIISHPHGCPKNISVGKNVGRIFHNECALGTEMASQVYTNMTCMGSSGAPCFMFGDLLETFSGYSFLPPHKKALSIKDKTNSSGVGRSMPSYSKILREWNGESKDEEKLKEFISVKDLNLNNLPEWCRECEVLEMVKALSGEVCRLVSKLETDLPAVNGLLHRLHRNRADEDNTSKTPIEQKHYDFIVNIDNHVDQIQDLSCFRCFFDDDNALELTCVEVFDETLGEIVVRTINAEIAEQLVQRRENVKMQLTKLNEKLASIGDQHLAFVVALPRGGSNNMVNIGSCPNTDSWQELVYRTAYFRSCLGAVSLVYHGKDHDWRTICLMNQEF